MSVLSKKGDRQDKIKLSFRLWDLERKGVISEGNLSQLLGDSLKAEGLLMSEEQMQQFVHATFTTTHPPHSHRITPEEFSRLVDIFPSMLDNMTLVLKGEKDDKKK
eukprot:gene8356-65803_t